jgi:cytochrome c556
MRSKLCLTALVIWLVTMGGLGWLFVRGWTTEGSDRRTAIMLAPSEQDQILSEMRLLLKAVHGVVTGLSRSDGDVKAVEEAARAAGMTMAADVNPALMAKLPLAFKQMGMSVHQDMDQLAVAVVQGESPPQLLRRLSSITARCTTCHDLYRFSAIQ